jgi:hypothetical protein
MLAASVGDFFLHAVVLSDFVIKGHPVDSKRIVADY